MVELYSDGSSTPGGGATGWAWVMVRDGKIAHSDHGGDPVGTNNTAELKAAIQGLKAVGRIFQTVRDGEEVVLVSDSRYVLSMARGIWSAATNLEQIQELRNLYNKYCTGTRWVRGHSGDPMNERCDRLAKKARHAQQVSPC